MRIRRCNAHSSTNSSSLWYSVAVRKLPTVHLTGRHRSLLRPSLSGRLRALQGLRERRRDQTGVETSNRFVPYRSADSHSRWRRRLAQSGYSMIATTVRYIPRRWLTMLCIAAAIVGCSRDGSRVSADNSVARTIHPTGATQSHSL